VKDLLFRPFDLPRWLVMGFCAWLSTLGQAGGGGGGMHANPLSGSGGDVRRSLEDAQRWVMGNLEWLVPVVLAVGALLLVVWVVILWLNCRGQFMFLHNVVTGRAEVREPWSYYAGRANGLWGFRLALGLAGLVVIAPLLLACAGLVITMILQGSVRPLFVVLCVAAFLGCLLTGTVFALVDKFTLDFVVPLMALRHGRCLSAWGELRGLLGAQPGTFILYILFQILLSIAIGTAVLVVVLVTCCCAGCLLAVPFLGTLLLLPVLVFRRAYSLYYLAQFGDSYRLLALPAL
jgi:hypothetical protein